MTGTLKLYKSYSFKDKDPMIDRLRTIVQDEGLKAAQVADLSGVSATTLYNWFDGPTLRPQFATIMAVTRSLGYDLQIFDPKTGKTMSINSRKR
jgi:DNA-binding phage protein